jgi:hypothetical protein
MTTLEIHRPEPRDAKTRSRARKPARVGLAGHSHRIAPHLADLNAGGVQRVMLTLASALAERGHQVDLLVGDARAHSFCRRASRDCRPC